MPPYTIVKNAQQHLLQIEVAGQWDLDIVEAHRRDVTAALLNLRKSGRPRVLVDAREQGLQSKQVAAALGAVIADLTWAETVVAIVVPRSVLTVMQGRRIGAALPNAHHFAERSDALSWLLAQD